MKIAQSILQQLCFKHKVENCLPTIVSRLLMSLFCKSLADPSKDQIFLCVSLIIFYQKEVPAFVSSTSDNSPATFSYKVSSNCQLHI